MTTPRLARLGTWSSPVKYDWMAAFTLAQVFQQRQYRYVGGRDANAGFKFRERSRVLLFNAGRTRQALDLAANSAGSPRPAENTHRRERSGQESRSPGAAAQLA